MKKTFRLFAIAIIISTPFILGSCLGLNDTEKRTTEIEKAELNEAIAKLHSLGYNVDTTALGVYYVISKAGTGPFPKTGDTCSVIYAGYFLNGTIFDASYYHNIDSIWEFSYKENDLIPGFDDGIALLNKGAKADIIIPSSLAYGPSGNIGIPPYTPIIFTLKMKNLRPKAR